MVELTPICGNCNWAAIWEGKEERHYCMLDGHPINEAESCSEHEYEQDLYVDYIARKERKKDVEYQIKKYKEKIVNGLEPKGIDAR